MVRRVNYNEGEYPENLKNIYGPPDVLHINGSILPQDKIAIALVGSRRASMYGIEMSEKLAYELALRQVTVVSGMAKGIDTAAHRGALKAKGRTIAVLGSGHNNIYPPENARLYEEISKSGAVVSEFEDDMPPLPKNFPRRNRIISGMSLGVVVVEAAKNSGALITANFAAEQGREVYAVPGKISSHTSTGTNELIKDGAKLIQSVDDILEEMPYIEIKPLSGPDKEDVEKGIAKMTRAYVYNSLTEDERKVYKNLSDEPLHIDEILNKTGLGLQKVSKVLLDLELKRLIKEIPGKQYLRKG